MVKSLGRSGYQLDLLLNHSMTLGKILNLLEPLFPHVHNDYNDYGNDYNRALSYCEN